MYVAYFLLLLLYIVKNCSRMLWMICNSNLRISISCNESSVSSAAAAAAAAVEDDVLPSSHDVVSNEVRKLVYLLPIFDNDPRAATVPLPVRIRSLSHWLWRGGERWWGAWWYNPSFVCGLCG